MFVRIYIDTYIDTYTHANVYMYIHACVGGGAGGGGGGVLGVCVCACVCVRACVGVCTYTGRDEEEIPEHVKEAMRHSAPTSLPQSVTVLLPKGRGALKSPTALGKPTQTLTDKQAASPLRGTCVQVLCVCVFMIRSWGSGVWGCACLGVHVLAPTLRLLVFATTHTYTRHPCAGTGAGHT